MIFKNAGENHPCLPVPAAFGWTLDTGSIHFSPVHCLHQPSLEAILNLIAGENAAVVEGAAAKRKYPVHRSLRYLGFQLQQKNYGTKIS